MQKIQVLLVDDHPLFRQGLTAALRNEGAIVVVGEAGNVEQARDLAHRFLLDVAIVDLLLPGVSGIGIVHELVNAQPACRMLGLSVIDEPGLIADMLRAGATGYALKTQPIEEIIAAIHTIEAGRRYLPPRVSVDAIDRELATPPSQPLARLTRREREIFELMIRGYSNSEISTRLFIAQRTVETHRQRITKKLSARSIFELQRIAARYGGLGA